MKTTDAGIAPGEDEENEQRVKKIAYYITPHGFGHAVRSLEVIRHLLWQKPSLEITVVSDIAEFLVEQRVGKLLPFRRKRLDVGLVQEDSIRFNLQATRQALQTLFQNRKALVAEEVRFIKDEGIQTVVSDIAFLPFQAASRCGIPAIGLGNFTWDWIYARYSEADPSWHPLIAWIKESYRQCDLLLQLPMHGDCSSCPKRRQVPLVVRKADRPPAATRRLVGWEPDKKHYLIAFSHLDLSENALNRLAAIPNTIFLFKHPLSFRFANGRSLDAFDLSYSDVVAAVDGVITKPGYGIVADCLVHGTPIAYTDRGPFPEYDILVEAIQQHLPNVHLPSEDLYAGRWEGVLPELAGQPRRPFTIRDDGAAVCAGLIIQRARGVTHDD